MNKKARVKLLVSLGIASLMAVLFLLSVKSRAYQILELKALDLRFVLTGDRPVEGSPVVHIDIDDQSLAELGRWPWPRKFHADMTRILKECGARQILMDVLFTEESKEAVQDDLLFSSVLSQTGISYLPFYFLQEKAAPPSSIKSLLYQDITLSVNDLAKKLNEKPEAVKEGHALAKKLLLDEAIHAFLLKEPSLSLDALLEGIEQERGWFLFPEDETYIREHYEAVARARYFFNKFSLKMPSSGWPFLHQERQPCPPIMSYLKHLKGSGFINAEPDLDGVTRRVPLFLRHENGIFPQLTVSALLDWLEVKKVEVRENNIILEKAHLNGQIKDIVIPVDPKGNMLVNWAGRWGVSFDHIPYYLILRLQQVRDQMAIPSEAQAPGSDQGALSYLKKTEDGLIRELTAMVKGKMCIVGLTATGTNDLHPIPIQENYPMVGTHSNLVNTILTESFIFKQDGLLRVGIFFLMALLVAVSSLMKLWKSLLLSVGILAGYFMAAFFVFVRFGVWIDMVGPFGIVVFGFALITSYRFLTEEKEKLWIKKAFSHYLSNDVISELMEDPSRLKLGGERRVITVFFSDIRGFTAFSESRQPEEVVAMLNEMLSLQVDVVFRNGGTLDKFVGDELMAFFGAPGDRHLKDHALVAVKVAVEIQAKMRQLQAKRVQEGKHPLQIGVGINTGEMVVGNMGSSVRMDYTVIGDNVNLAARLCSAAGKDEIIISESTYAMVAEHVLADRLEPVAVKGKIKPIQIYRVTGLKQKEKAAAEPPDDKIQGDLRRGHE